MALGIELVPGRSCGECTLCCTNLAIDTKEYRKVPGVPCAHLCAQGCGIYDTRYPVCRTYFCGWRCMDALGEEWRPDRSGILFDALPDEELPAQYRAGGRNLRITLFGRPASDKMETLYRFVSTLIAGGVLVVLAVPGPPGHDGAHVVLNVSLQEAAENGDLFRIEAFISEVVVLARDAPFKPVRFENTD